MSDWYFYNFVWICFGVDVFMDLSDVFGGCSYVIVMYFDVVFVWLVDCVEVQFGLVFVWIDCVEVNLLVLML